MTPLALLNGVDTRYTAIRRRLETLAFDAPWKNWAYEFVLFGFKQGWACLFGALLLALLIGTFLFYPAHAPLARYDFLVLACVAIQVAMLAFRLESLDEARVILAFHVVGTIMEVYKTHAGSWTYPEPSVLRIGGVPLFSGFMYAAVGSYIARVWRIFDFRFSRYPPRWTTLLLALVIYANFFTHHFLPDARGVIFAVTAALFLRTWVWFTPLRTPRRMPLLVGFLLVALFIWFAENLATFARAWIYPQQQHGWQLVKWQKLGAWYLLMIISFVLVTLVSRPRPPDAPTA